MINDHEFLRGDNGRCCYSWVTHGSGTELEICRGREEYHTKTGTQQQRDLRFGGGLAQRDSTVLLDGQEAIADSPMFIPMWLNPDTPSKEDAQMAGTLVYRLGLDMLNDEVAFYMGGVATANIPRSEYESQGKPKWVEIHVPVDDKTAP